MHRGRRGARGRDQRGGVVNLKGFFVTALSSALELEVATPDDVLRHVTPDILSIHLPRPLWARLLTACLGAPRVDAQLVVETIGVPNLCEHVPQPIMWACLQEIGRRAIGAEGESDGVVVVHDRKAPSQPLIAPSPPPVVATGTPVATPVIAAPALPAPTIPRPTTANPLGDLVSELESEQERDRLGGSSSSSSSSPSRARTPTSQRFRQSQTGIGRLAPTSLTSPRRPQAAAPSGSLPSVLGGRSSNKTPPPPAEPETFEVVTEMGKDDWKNALAVEDEQLVDWQAADETITTADDFTGRKR
jgi:hypothetical protein